MIQRLELEQGNVLGFRISGKLDHDSFLTAAHDLAEKLDQHDHFNIYIEISEPEGIEFRVVWDSVRFAMAHFRQYLTQIDHIAVVSDSNWIHRITQFENMILAGITDKAFRFSDKHKAMNWVQRLSVMRAA